MTKLSDAELYELGVKAHDTAKPRRNTTAAYGIGYEDGTVYDPKYLLCHGWFKCSTIPQTAYDPVVIASVVQNKCPKIAGKELRDFYYNYLLNESPFAPVFLSKDVNKLESEGIISRLDVQHAYAIAASIGTRHVWEWPWVPKTFNNLVQAGLDKDRAFLSAFCLKWLDVSTKPVVLFTEGHTCVYVRSMNKNGVINFLNHNMPKEGMTYSERRTYRGIELLWNQGKDNEWLDGPLEKFREVFKSEVGVNIRVKDPFGVIEVAKAARKERTVVERINEIFDEIVG